MNFQEKVFATTADLRDRAAAFATAALEEAKARAGVTAQRIDQLKGSVVLLNAAGRELNQMARRHGARFLKQNSTLAAAVGKDVSALARETYASFVRKPA